MKKTCEKEDCSNTFTALHGGVHQCSECRVLGARGVTWEEKSMRVSEWLDSKGVSRWWLGEEYADDYGYDVRFEVPHLGMIRMTLGRRRKRSEVWCWVDRGTRGLHFKYRCDRLYWPEKGWKKKKKKDWHMWPGECECLGCKVRMWVDEDEV